MDIESESIGIGERISAAIDSARQVSFDWDIQHDRLFLSGVLTESFKGVLVDSAQNWTSRAFIEIFYEADIEKFRTHLHNTLRSLPGQSSHTHNAEFRFKHANRGLCWIEIHANVVERSADGRALRMVGTISDIDQRKQAEKKIARLGDLYVTLSQTSQAIVRVNDRQVLFDEICRIAVEHGKFHMAWIGLVDWPSGRIIPVASAGHSLDFLDQITVSVDESIPEGRGSIGSSIRSGRPSISNDFLASEHLRPWWESAARSGFHALATFPFLKEGAPFGSLTVYATERQFFDEQSIGLLEEMAGDISFAIDNFEREKRREAAESALAESEKLKASILAAALDSIISIDEQGLILTFNPAAEATFGYRSSDVIGKQLADAIVPLELREAHFQGMARYVKTRTAHILNRRIEQLALRADGTTFPAELTVVPSDTKDGLIFTAFIRDISARKQSEIVLRDSALRYRQLVELSPEPIVVHRNGKLVLLNQAAVQLLGIPDLSQILDTEILRFIHPDFHRAAIERARQSEHAGSDRSFAEETWLRYDGAPLDVEVAASNLDYDGQPTVQIVVRDLTSRKRVDALQSGQNRILNMVAISIGLPDILNDIARFVEVQSGDGICSISLVSEDGLTLAHGAAPSLPASYVTSVEGLKIGPASGSCGTAAFRGEPVIVPVIQASPLWLQYRHLADAHDLRACSSWPIFGKNRRVLGVVALYRKNEIDDTVSPDDLRLFDIATNLASIAIEGRESEERIRRLAHFDGLTGLPNRFLFKEFLDHALHAAHRHAQNFAVFFLDLDRFKTINDTLGHDAGDQTLRVISSRLQAILRKADTIARMGGDEFYILLENLPAPHYAAEIAQKLLNEASRPFTINGHECQLTASIGIVIYPNDGVDEQTLLKNSDIAMYRAKHAGKNAFEFYSASKDEHSAEKLGLESRLRRAIENREFILHYQPKIDLRTRQITGVEALARWQHPQHGVLAPSHFIAIAEDTGLILALGKQLLETAGQDWLKLQAAGFASLRIAVNLSARQLDDGDLVADIENLLHRTGRAWLDLEITESMTMHHPEKAAATMNQLVSMGIRLSIDDFGTGYSSLSYLKRFPVHSIKVDRSFVQDIPADPNDTAITKAIIAMGSSLGMRVIAEGVETSEQETALEQFGCDEYQGFFFCRPIPFEELTRWLAANDKQILRNEAPAPAAYTSSSDR